MRHLFKDHVVRLRRLRTSLGRDLSGLRLDRNERVEPLPEAVVREMFARFRPEDLCAHPEVDDFYPLLARFLGLDQDCLYLVNGVTEGVRIICDLLCRPGQNVVALDPGYPMYRVNAELCGLTFRPWTYGADLAPDMAALDAALDVDTAVLLLANPNLPVESCFGLDELARLADRCAANGSALVIDEAYHYFGAPSAIPLALERDNVVVLRTFSKAFGLASIRLGFMVSRPENIEYLAKSRSLVESNTFSLGLASYMLEHPEIMRAHVASVAEGARVLTAGLDRLGVRHHGGRTTNGMLLFLAPGQDPAALIAHLRARKIYVRGAFAAPFDTCVRVSIGAPQAMRTFLTEFEAWLARNGAAEGGV